MPKGRVVSARRWRKSGSWTVGPIKLSGKQLLLNVRAHGALLRVVILDENNQPIPGYDQTIHGVDETEFPVDWGQADLSALKDKPVKLRFELNNAEIFGFTCRP